MLAPWLPGANSVLAFTMSLGPQGCLVRLGSLCTVQQYLEVMG